MLAVSVIDLLPQQFPFQMVDQLLECNQDIIRTQFLIQHDNVLVAEHQLCEGGLIENMAQSAAAATGYLCKKEGKEVPVGYIGAIKNVLIHRLPMVGETLQTELNTKFNVGQATIVEGKIFSDKESIASCELTIFVNQ